MSSKFNSFFASSFATKPARAVRTRVTPPADLMADPDDAEIIDGVLALDVPEFVGVTDLDVLAAITAVTG